MLLKVSPYFKAIWLLRYSVNWIIVIYRSKRLSVEYARRIVLGHVASLLLFTVEISEIDLIMLMLMFIHHKGRQYNIRNASSSHHLLWR